MRADVFLRAKTMQTKSAKDLETQGIASLMLRYCLPTILATTVNAAYNAVDRIFVGRACGEDALAAITVCFSPTLLLLSIAMTIGQGSAAILSIKLGEKNYEDASKILSQALFLFVVFYIAAASAISLYMDEILTFFGATQKLLPDARAYYSVIIAGLIFEKISFGINNLIRAEGRPAYAMSTMLIGGWANVVLDYIFLFVFETGVVGAAYATVLSQMLGSLWVGCFYLSGRSCLKIRLRDMKVHSGLFRDVCEAGSPSLIMQFFAGLCVSLYIKQACEYGSEPAIAVVGIAMSITTFMFLPIVGLAMGMQPIVGYNWGAKNFARVKRTFLCGIVFSTCIGLAGFAAGECFPRLFYAVFLGRESELAAMGSRVLRILILCYPLIGVNIITSGFFQSTKRPVYSITVSVLRQAVFLIPLMYVLPEMFGVDGLWASFPISDFMAFVITLVFIKYKILKKIS